MYRYGYMVGCLMLLSVWILFYFLRKDLRKEQVLGSLLATPFGFLEMFFVREYWNPPSIFRLIERYGFGIESFLFCFAGGGIAAIIYKVVTFSKTRKFTTKYKGFAPYILFIGLLLTLEVFRPTKTIYNSYIATFIGGVCLAFFRPDLVKQMVISGLVFGLLYFGLFIFFNQMFPNYIGEIYVLDNFLGINIVNVPIEEILFAFFAGGFWSVIYDYAKGYKAGPRRI